LVSHALVQFGDLKHGFPEVIADNLLRLVADALSAGAVLFW
jgi:hypothetical protein